MLGKVEMLEQSPREFSRELSAGNGALAAARREFGEWLAHHGVDPEHVSDLLVVLSELAANAIAAAEGHGNGPIAIRSWCTEDEVMLEVETPAQDQVHGIVVHGDSDPLRGSGRGLLIVAAYADKIEVVPPGQASGLIMRCHKHV